MEKEGKGANSLKKRKGLVKRGKEERYGDR